MFDLPTGNQQERRSYTLFRKFLLDDGYTMEQYSIYTRISLSRESMNTHIERLKNNLPESGEVTVLTLTEKQYEDRQVLVKKSTETKQTELGAQLTLVF